MPTHVEGLLRDLIPVGAPAAWAPADGAASIRRIGWAPRFRAVRVWSFAASPRTRTSNHLIQEDRARWGTQYPGWIRLCISIDHTARGAARPQTGRGHAERANMRSMTSRTAVPRAKR
jgi:hypothetical protein